MRHTAGHWQRADSPIFFLASSPHILFNAASVHKHMLVAVNELMNSDSQQQSFHKLLDADVNILMDSGVYGLASAYATLNNINPNVVRQMPAEEIPGFEPLLASYKNLVSRYADRLWGYIEMDWGTAEQKATRRATLEAIGLAPIPVYHPIWDPMDYFDELAQNYDRICIGNTASSDNVTRLRLIATAVQRRQKYPHLWMHMLGVTPSEWCAAYAFDSCDSSAWLSGVRWQNPNVARAMLKGFSKMQRGLVYQLGNHDDASAGGGAAVRAYGYDAHMNAMNWRAMCRQPLLHASR